jgi:hypothetical protein
VKRLPASSWLSTESVPPWATAMARAIARPSPVPPVSLARAASRRTKGSKMRSWSVGAMLCLRLQRGGGVWGWGRDGAWERGAGKGREGAEGVDVDYALTKATRSSAKRWGCSQCGA